MFRMLRHSCVLLIVVGGLAADLSPGIREALGALQRGDFPAAEATLRSELKARPEDGGALTLLGVALDNQKKFQEAADAHRRAAGISPNSPDVWNNYGNHLIGTGDPEGARKLYLRVISLDPSSYNANVQLARLALRAKKGVEALDYVKHLSAVQQDAPNLAPLRLEALYLAGETAQADTLGSRWLAAAREIPGESLAIGMALADAGRFEPAETFLTQALAQTPSDFNVQVNLGLASWHTGHYDRARETLQAALAQQPENVDAIYYLACVNQAVNRTEAAVSLFAQAARLAPQRPDVQRQLALATGDLGALDDSAAAWDRYLKLQPNDDVARRERGLIAFQMGKFEQGVAELRWFVARHPDDAVGHFELGAAENKDDPAQALSEFDRAVALNANFAAAHSARGGLYYQMGNPKAAVVDLEAAASLRPDNAIDLDRLGQTYLALDRTADAVRVLRKAAALSPDDSKTQLHLARALADAGQEAESKAAMDRFRQLGPAVNRAVPGGLVDYLSLSPEQRRADYLARVERQVRQHPDDAQANVNYLRLLLEEGAADRSAETARKIAGLKPPAATLADAGRALLEARQYGPARELLEQAAKTTPSADLELDLAIATFHESGPAEGARLLDRVPDSHRGGDYYLARAEILEASGAADEAAAAVDRALRATPGQTRLYLRACAILLHAGRSEDALRISAAAMEAFAQDREILLLRAVILERAGRTVEAEPLLQRIENRWPEWPDAWTAGGVVLAARGRRDDACVALRTALSLGARSREVKTYLDQLSAGAAGNPPDLIRMLFSKPSDRAAAVRER
jgi:tetratricopeptide (TPR) repeat protein